MTTLREAAQQALEALVEINKLSIGEHAICLPGEIDTAMDALRAALAEPVQNEPLAWFRLDEKTNESFLVWFPSADGKDWRPLYAAPRKPVELTDDQIVDIWAGVSMGYDDEINIIELARAIERAHGIGEQT